MKLLLTSNGFTSRKINTEFVRLLDKKPKEMSVLIIAGIVKKKHFKYIAEQKKYLSKLGIKKFKIVNVAENINAKKFNEFDVILFMGGNTFYLLDRIRRTGFVNYIKKHIKRNKLYIGISAGSIIVHKSIEIAGWGTSADPNLIGLSDLSGLAIINTAIFPHYKRINKLEVINFRKNVDYPIKVVRDGEAVVIIDKKTKIIR